MLSNSNFVRNTHAIRSALNLKWEEYIDSFGMTPKEAKKYLLNSQELPLRLAMNFCEHFGLDLGMAYSEEFDAKVFARNYLKGPPALPEQYQRERNSKAITLINFVRALNEEGLEWLIELILRRMQVPKTILLYPELDIPFKLIMDFMTLLEKFSQDFEFMKNCGQEGVMRLNSIFNFAQPGMRLTAEFYDEFFTKKINQFDKTYDYRVISHKKDEIVVESALKDEFKELYKLQKFYSHALLEYKSGISNGLSAVLGHSLGETTIISSPENKNDYFKIKMPTPLSSYPRHWH
jgi:hypothetical protein